MTSGQELGAWLRQQREARSWARSEMARQLIRAANANGDTSIPGADSLAQYIYRWERGIVGPSERYRLYYCQAFGILPADFGTVQEEGLTYRFRFSAGDVAEAFCVLSDLKAMLRDLVSLLSSPEGKKMIPGDRRLRNDRVANLPDPGDAVRIADFAGDHIGWSVFWDKRYGVWRVSEDDPHSDLYAESKDAQQVIDYVAAHS
jgi:transcriptional regulator with XRE-family HTH domain